MVVLFRLAAFMAKHKLSLRLYEELVVLLKQSGVDVGDTDHSRITAREMNEVIAGHGRGQVKEFIETPLDIFSGGRISELLLISCLIYGVFSKPIPLFLNVADYMIAIMCSLVAGNELEATST